MMKNTMKKAMVAMMAALTLTGAVASTSTVFACDEDFSSGVESTSNASQAIVRVSKGYLALRTRPAYDERNEIGELYSGDIVLVKYHTNNGYVYVYSYKYKTCGYVNASYLF